MRYHSRGALRTQPNIPVELFAKIASHGNNRASMTTRIGYVT